MVILLFTAIGSLSRFSWSCAATELKSYEGSKVRFCDGGEGICVIEVLEASIKE